MDTSASSAAVAMNQRLHTRKLILTIALLFGLCTLMVAGGLFDIAHTLDREALQQSRFYADRALRNRLTAAGNDLLGYAYWTSAYNHLNGAVDVKWAYTEGNLGESLFRIGGYEGVFVVDHDTTKYALVRGRIGQPPADRDFALHSLDLLSRGTGSIGTKCPRQSYRAV